MGREFDLNWTGKKNVYEVQEGQSIQTYLSAASSGDTVQVFPGTYTGNITVPSGVTLELHGATITGDVTLADATARVLLFGGASISGTVSGGNVEYVREPGTIKVHEGESIQTAIDTRKRAAGWFDVIGFEAGETCEVTVSDYGEFEVDTFTITSADGQTVEVFGWTEGWEAPAGCTNYITNGFGIGAAGDFESSVAASSLVASTAIDGNVVTITWAEAVRTPTTTADNTSIEAGATLADMYVADNDVNCGEVKVFPGRFTENLVVDCNIRVCASAPNSSFLFGDLTVSHPLAQVIDLVQDPGENDNLNVRVGTPPTVFPVNAERYANFGIIGSIRPMPHMISHPYPSQIAIFIDDTINPSDWFTTAATGWDISDMGLTNQTPEAYLRRKGFPLTLATIANNLGTGSGAGHYFTVAEVARLFQFSACEIAVHDVETTLDSRDDIVAQTLTLRDAIEALEVSGSRIGLMADGWVQPGDNVPSFDSHAKLGGPLGDVIRENFLWARNYVNKGYGYHPASRLPDRHGLCSQIGIETACASDDGVQKVLDILAQPGNKVICTGHFQNLDTADKKGRFKTLIDGICALRDARLACPVTMTTMLRSILASMTVIPASITGGDQHICEVPWGGVPGGNFEWDTLVLATYDRGLRVDAEGTTLASLETSDCDLHDLSPGQCLQLDRNGDSTSANNRAIWNPSLPSGTHMGRFDIKCIEGPGTVKINIANPDAGGNNQWLESTITIGSDWVTVYVPLGVGYGSTGRVGVYIYQSSATPDQILCLDNFECIPI